MARKNPARKINERSYKYYVVFDGQIQTGWDYREDAKDDLNEYKEEWPSLYKRMKILQRVGLKQIGLDPDINSHWGNKVDVAIRGNPSRKPNLRKVKRKNPASKGKWYLLLKSWSLDDVYVYKGSVKAGFSWSRTLSGGKAYATRAYVQRVRDNIVNNMSYRYAHSLVIVNKDTAERTFRASK